jgi:hypothetical protein
VFVVSLHRCGTRSTTRFLKELGLRSLHRPTEVGGVDLLQAVAGREADLETVADVMTPVIDGADAIGDVPIPAIYDVLARRYSNARFILVWRDTNDWIDSVRRHSREIGYLSPYGRALYWRYFPRLKPRKIDELSDLELLWMENRHTAEVISYFRSRPERLGVFHLNDPQIGQKISRFLGRTPDAAVPAFPDEGRSRVMSPA